MYLSPASSGGDRARFVVSGTHLQPGLAPFRRFDATARPSGYKLEIPVSQLLTPPARYIDPRGQRFGAGLSAVLLVIAFATQQFWLAALVGLNLLIAAAFGSRLFLPGRPWPLIRKWLRLGPTEPEHEYPPRFAQALGGTFVAIGSVVYVAGLAGGGWLLIGAVAGLQTLLATTGYCLGCRMYFLRWWVPSQFARLFRRNDRLLKLPVQPLRQV
jgi:hypothetical protein